MRYVPIGSSDFVLALSCSDRLCHVLHVALRPVVVGTATHMTHVVRVAIRPLAFVYVGMTMLNVYYQCSPTFGGRRKEWPLSVVHCTVCGWSLWRKGPTSLALIFLHRPPAYPAVWF